MSYILPIYRKLFHKDNFLRKFGDEMVPISTIPYASSFGQTSSVQNNMKYVSFNELANNASISNVSIKSNMNSMSSEDGKNNHSNSSDTEYYYAFTTALPQWNQKISGDVEVPSNIIRSEVDDDGNLQRNPNIELQFYLGPAGSGAPMHFHGHAVNTLAYGMKQWYIYPPGEGFYSTQPALEFVKNDRRSGTALQCVQYGGDVLYVPSLWSHATLNAKQSIGVAHEFSVETFCMD